MGQLIPARIPRGQTVALDTVSIVYFLEKHPVHFQTAKDLFSRIEGGEIIGLISSLVFAELLVPAYRDGQTALADAIVKILLNFPNLATYPLTPEISQKAAEIRATHNLRTPDAIHLATALAGKADCFITNDRALERLKKDGLMPILLFA
jgi:predicted nucleic acid-binding protein